MAESAAGAEPAETSMDNKSVLCRLCLRHGKSNANIFEDVVTPLPATPEQRTTLSERLFDLLQVKFEPSNLLPSNICQPCLSMVEAFRHFRLTVQICENELQHWLQQAKERTTMNSADQLPGVNGNPGAFEPPEGYTVIVVDPEQDYESSEDDFSMESDSDMEDMSALPPISTNFSEQPSQLQEQPQSNEESIIPLPAELNTSQLNVGNNQHNVSAPPVLEPVTYVQPTVTNNSDLHGLEMVVKNTFLCQFCDMAFTTKAECIDHESQHDNVAPYICSFCSLRTHTRQILIFHIREVHDPDRPYICVLCNKGFCRRSDLKKHTIVHTGVRPFTCPVCGKSFSRNTNLTKHIRIHNSDKPHVCQRCPRSFSTAIEMLRHTRTHVEVKPFQCNRCPASFTRRDKLQQHEQAHYRRDAEFLANQSKGAGLAGISSIDIKEEQGLHSNSAVQMENMLVPLNPYAEQEASPINPAVPLPQETFRQQSILAGHLQQRGLMPKHAPVPKQSQPRNFACTICNKAFTRQRDLQRHQALHLDTLFTCNQCGVGFSRREKLKRHELEFHAPQYSCDICRTTFIKRDEFEMHTKMHELQQNAAMATQAAMSVASGSGLSTGVSIRGNGAAATSLPNSAAGTTISNSTVHTNDVATTQRPSAADISFYSQLVPTMNLGFYSETRPEDRNGI